MEHYTFKRTFLRLFLQWAFERAIFHRTEILARTKLFLTLLAQVRQNMSHRNVFERRNNKIIMKNGDIKKQEKMPFWMTKKIPITRCKMRIVMYSSVAIPTLKRQSFKASQKMNTVFTKRQNVDYWTQCSLLDICRNCRYNGAMRYERMK
jgi:hypothetical protein